ncbi:MAG: aldo/keto reductase [Planctomycetales bacterium]|nr:aldo/keto reductase [Planctomycetales bacterium]
MIDQNLEYRPLGQTGLSISPVALGCWPIAGMTSLDVNDTDSLATLRACESLGVNFLDTAYAYGPNGESERLIAEAIGDRRDNYVIATKCGIHWNDQIERVINGRPERLRAECDESLRRLNTDRVDLLYLHAPDPETPVEESAGALLELMQAGKARSIGVSNFNVDQLERFHAICPITAVQPPYNMLQRQIEQDVLPWCRHNGVNAMVYWPLMKGLLAGRLPRDYQFQPGDGRAKYPMFHGDEWQKNQDFLDELRAIAAECNKTVAQVVVNWTIWQPGVTAALCGAKRASQIEETAGAMGWRLTGEQTARIESALARRGEPIVRSAV